MRVYEGNEGLACIGLIMILSKTTSYSISNNERRVFS